ncbi:MAG: 2-oxo acid dehydrogenase subunit E2 [Propionibacteriaceae bacterium]|nr:2-oxo acid dehydrogenase subunit E2 [Propionibacteriaceae bacterium]
MSHDITLPTIPSDSGQGTVSRWLKNRGEPVAIGEPILEISTDKADIEIAATVGGVLTDLRVREDDIVSAGDVIARVDDDWPIEQLEPTVASDSTPQATDTTDAATAEPADPTTPVEPTTTEEPAATTTVAEAPPTSVTAATAESPTTPAAPAGGDGQTGIPPLKTAASALPDDAHQPGEGQETHQQAEGAASISTATPLVAPAPTPDASRPLTTSQSASSPASSGHAPTDHSPVSAGEHHYATPLIRKLATEAGLDLNNLTGSGVGGRIRREDIEAARQAMEATGDGLTPNTPMPVQAAVAGPVPPSIPTPTATIAAPDLSQSTLQPGAVGPATHLVQSEQSASPTAAFGLLADGLVPPRTSTSSGFAAQPIPSCPLNQSSPANPADAPVSGAYAPTQPANQPGSAPLARPMPTAISPAHQAPLATSAAALPPVTPAPVPAPVMTTTPPATVPIIAPTSVASLVFEVDLTALMRAINYDLEALDPSTRQLLILARVAAAVATALQTHPQLNTWTPSGPTGAGGHLAIAIDSPTGFVAPVIHDVADLSWAGLLRRVTSLVERVRQGLTTPAELTGATFELIDLMDSGLIKANTAIAASELASLSLATPLRRPVALVEPNLGEIVTVRSIIALTLAYDPSRIDTHDALAFIAALQADLASSNLA